MEHDDESELIEDILDGDAQAYAVLVRRYQGPIHALMLRMCRHAEDARDLTQETFVTAYEKLDRFKMNARFFPWLYTIGLNLARDHLRRRGRSPLPAADCFDGCLETIAADVSDDSLIDRIDADRLLAAMDGLGLETREALLLRYQEGLSITEIATALDLSASAVKMRLSRGLERLRTMFLTPANG